MRRMTLKLLTICVLVLIPLSTAQANDHLEITHSDNPPVPQLGANMDVPLNYGWEMPAEFPTTTEKWIDVDLSDQRAVAYEGTRPVRAFVISSGLPGTPTVKGTFRIWVRTRVQTMSGGSLAGGNYYSLPNVEWVQYFHGDYAFHGAYWHNNFGQPMSRGCINMRNEDAEWLFKWAMPEYDDEGGWLQPTEENATLVLVRD